MIENDHPIPQVIKDHFAAYGTGNSAAFASTFAKDALVNDVKREFRGRDAIQAWADREIFLPKVTAEVKSVRDQFGSTIARVQLDGEYDKTGLPDPLILTYYFNVVDEEISQLIILLNKEDAS